MTISPLGSFSQKRGVNAPDSQITKRPDAPVAMKTDQADLTRLRHELAEADALIAHLAWLSGVNSPRWPNGTNPETALQNHTARRRALSEPEIG